MSCIMLAACTTTTSAVTSTRLSSHTSRIIRRGAAQARLNDLNNTSDASQAGGGFQCYYANDTAPACDINLHFGASGHIPAPSDVAGKKYLAYLVANDTACRTAGRDEATCTAAQGRCEWYQSEMTCYGAVPDWTTFFCVMAKRPRATEGKPGTCMGLS